MLQKLKYIVYQLFNARGSFHPQQRKSTSHLYITFELKRDTSLFPHFEVNLCSFKDFVGNLLFLRSVTGPIMVYEEWQADTPHF